jgi:hypothetical protein
MDQQVVRTYLHFSNYLGFVIDSRSRRPEAPLNDSGLASHSLSPGRYRVSFALTD